MDEATKRKIAEKARARWASPEFRERVRPKLSAAHAGKPWSEKQREAAPDRAAKIAAALTGQKWSEDRLARHREARQDPEWRENLRQKNLEAYRRPEVISAWKEGQRRAGQRWATQGTGIEIAVRDELNSRRVNFVEQYPIAGWIVDFYLPDANLAIECDGEYWHSLPEVVERDQRKGVMIWQANTELVRLSESEINANVKKAVDRVLAATTDYRKR